MSGALLAGGASKRFGSPKALAQHEGKPFYQLSLDWLHSYCDDVMVSCNDPLLFKGESLNIVADETLGQGPLGGVLTLLKKSSNPWVLILACDMPLLEKEVIDLLLDFIHLKKKVICYQVKDQLHPFPGLYHQSLIEDLEKRLCQKKYSVRSFIDSLLDKEKQVLYLDQKDSNFININTKEDLKAL